MSQLIPAQFLATLPLMPRFHCTKENAKSFGNRGKSGKSGKTLNSGKSGKTGNVFIYISELGPFKDPTPPPHPSARTALTSSRLPRPVRRHSA